MLEGFFSPRSIVVVGVSRDETGVGHAVFDNIIRGGFTGATYPVNPHAEAIHGHRCYPSVEAVPEVADLAIIAVPAQMVPAALDECASRGTRSAIIVSAGFKETGPAGASLEREVVAIARAKGIRILGPNCLGLVSAEASLNASFAPVFPEPGNVAFMSQSGALGTAVLDWAAGAGVGLSHFVSLGNKADITEVDLVRAWERDPRVAVVIAYLETISQGRDFVEAVRSLTKTKPFIALKAGGSDAGARAVSSHTGSLAGSEAAYNAAFRACGAIRVHSVQELFDLSAAFSHQPLPGRSGLGILTNAGGPGVLATDAAEASGVPIASLDADTVRELQRVLPPAAAIYNPVDVLGDASPQRYEAAARALARDGNVGSVLAILTPQAMTDAAGMAEALCDAVEGTDVTVAASFMGGPSVATGVRALRSRGIPQYEFPERAVEALAAMDRYRTLKDSEPDILEGVTSDRVVVRRAIDHAQSAGRTFITEESASKIAAAYGIAVPQGGLARDLASARAIAARVGYPVVLKIASPDILHKSDIGGIAVDILDEESLARAYEQIMARVRTRMPDARVWGLTVQHQVPKGREVIVGVNRDPQFGPLLMFGLGGIYVEVLQDVTFRLCPVTRSEAQHMVSEIRSFGLLRGTRGQAPADTDAIADVIWRVSALVMDFPEITELDINPLIVADRGAGAIAADVRIGIGGS